MRYGQGQTHGKIILIGEHAVVYGAHALALPFFSTSVHVTISQGHDTMSSLLFNGQLSDVPEHLNGFITLYHHLKTQFFDNHMYHIDIRSTILPQRGMGSSAALAHALILAYADYHDLSLTEDDRFQLSMIAETINHGKPSGIDSLITMIKDPIIFQKGPWYKRVQVSLSGYLLVIDSNIVGNTKDAVELVVKKSHLKETKDTIQQIDDLVLLSQKALEHNKLHDLGDYMNQAHQHLDRLGVSHATINHMVELALDAGAIGAKMTGGGHGGCMIALVLTKRHAEHVTCVLKTNGFKQSWILDLREAFL